MAKAETMLPFTPKIALIKRDMLKLGMRHLIGVHWQKSHLRHWRKGEAIPAGWEQRPRVETVYQPTCPNCGDVVLMGEKGIATRDWLEAGKRHCKTCQEPLWQEAREPRKQGTLDNPRMRLDQYIAKRYRHRIALLVWDEVHEAAHGDTGNGEAFSRLASCAKRVLGLTGTPFNGRASSLFNVEYAINPDIRKRYPIGGSPRLSKRIKGNSSRSAGEGAQRGKAQMRFVHDMGVLESTQEDRPQYDSVSGVYTGTKTYHQPFTEAPGISPLLVAAMLDHTVYFSLTDLGKALPAFEEHAIPIEMDDALATTYNKTRETLKKYLMACLWEGDNSFRGAYLQWAMGWQSTPFRPYNILHRRREGKQIHERTVATLAPLGNGLYNKERKLVEILNTELAAGRKCVVYFRQTGERDILPRYIDILEQHVPDAKPFVLRSTVTADRREKVIENAVQDGMNVLLCNPELVKTGLDLVFASTIIFVELTFNLSTMMQAAARSYRLNQTQPLCKVIYLYYTGTMEETAIALMSRKQRAAKMLIGDAGLTGLDALTSGESSFEQALLEQLTNDDTVDPAALFNTAASVTDLDTQDRAFWVDNTQPDETNIIPFPVVANHDDTSLIPPQTIHATLPKRTYRRKKATLDDLLTTPLVQPVRLAQPNTTPLPPAKITVAALNPPTTVISTTKSDDTQGIIPKQNVIAYTLPPKPRHKRLKVADLFDDNPATPATKENITPLPKPAPQQQRALF